MSIRSKNTPRKYLNHLVHPIFQGVNRLFVVSFENGSGKTSCSSPTKVEIKDGNVKIDGKNFFTMSMSMNRLKMKEKNEKEDLLAWY